ncbi:hypothetical protein SD37_40035 [Amycolatopsis orientalis]|uniref:Uncharacterized protein n=2 Tax=Amycolatopsis orientalis TaxID=31958 RepID=A0A193CA23_AMYOR|nr:hypothetical protein SD37_40035 [Amycolatopsis orientalis]
MPPIAEAVPGQPCAGLTTPHLVHKIDAKPLPTWSGEYTAVITRCVRVGLVDAPIPPHAQLCLECHQTDQT